MPFKMSAEATPTVLIFVRALMLAQSSGSPEIGIEHLLAALEGKGTPADPVVSSGESFSPLQKLDMPLSAEAAAALAAYEDIPNLPLDVLRSALLAARG
jgi:hypothetical protein